MSSKIASSGGGAPFRQSLAVRLTAWYALSSFAVLVAFATVPYLVLSRNLRYQDQQFLHERVGLVRSILASHPDSSGALRQEVESEWQSGSGRRFLGRVWDEQGRVLAETPGMADSLPLNAVTAHAPRPATGREYVEVRGQDGRVLGTLSSAVVLGPRWVRVPFDAASTERVASPPAAGNPAPARAPSLPTSPTSVWIPGGETRLVQVALDLSDQESFLGGYLRLLWLMVGVSAAVSALLGYLFARRAIRPLSDITRGVLSTQASTLRKRIEVQGLPTELAVLATAYNGMLERLQESFERLSRFSADIAHELRTPLNNLLGQGEVALRRARSPEEYRDTIASGLEEARRVARIIDSLLFLARAEDPSAHLAVESVDLGREIEAVAAFYSAASDAARVSLRVDVPGTIATEVDRTLFQRALANLVENALRATAPGGSVSLSARRLEGGSITRVEVVDSGTGIASVHLPRIFDRFYRPDAARSADDGGSGLGLAIVRSIAMLHGGTAAIESEPGRGTRVILDLPTTRPAGEPLPPAASARPAVLASRGQLGPTTG